MVRRGAPLLCVSGPERGHHWVCRGPAAVAEYAIDDLPRDVMVAQFPAVCADRALRPDYDERALQWLLRVAQQNDPGRVLRRRLVRDARGAVVGWFVYLVERGGASEV